MLLMKVFAFAKMKVTKINDQLIELGRQFINNVENTRDLEIYLLDTSYHGREVIEHIADLNLLDLFDCPNMDNIISNLFWKGPYEQTGSPLVESTNFEILKSLLWDRN